MAQYDMPENKDPNAVVTSNYNEVVQPVVDYNTGNTSKKRSGFAVFVDDVASGITKDIVKPTLRNLAYQFIDLVSSSVKTAVARKIGGYSGNNYNAQSGFINNANYNPSDFRTRFNANDGFVHEQAVVVGGSAPIPTNDLIDPWKNNIGFLTQLDAEKAKRQMFYLLEKQHYITVYQFGRVCNQDWPFTWDNYGWTDLGSIRVRYDIAPHLRDNNGRLLPFCFADVPEPIYIDPSIRRAYLER